MSSSDNSFSHHYYACIVEQDPHHATIFFDFIQSSLDMIHIEVSPRVYCTECQKEVDTDHSEMHPLILHQCLPKNKLFGNWWRKKSSVDEIQTVSSILISASESSNEPSMEEDLRKLKSSSYKEQINDK